MGGVIVGESQEETQLRQEFDVLRDRVRRGLLEGTLTPRPGPVEIHWDTAWRFRRWWFRKVDVTRQSTGIWTSFGYLMPGVDPDEYSICFVSSEGKVGRFVGYLPKSGCYISQFDSPYGEDSLRIWIKGLQAILGELPESDEDYFFPNPA